MVDGGHISVQRKILPLESLRSLGICKAAGPLSNGALSLPGTTEEAERGSGGNESPGGNVFTENHSRNLRGILNNTVVSICR